ncbi:MAG TPA: histidinol dehydrogenase [Candidatus Deferrimicrobiaceae bacterium]|jgi:histidinol dehydrogenase|nr:histidinol dehydrogenase [Candidatus Deferrimicrobiaceae bacterium]
MRLRILEDLKKDRYVRALEKRGSKDLASVESTVRHVVKNVRKNGDRALRRYSERWDSLSKDEAICVPESDLHDAWQRIPSELQDAITRAAGNIRSYCEWQKPEQWRREIQPGVCVGQLVRPLESVGCYVPGGRYPLPSTLLMTVIPAQVAGVPEIRVVSPRPAQATLAAAAFLGVREFYRVGGAQAVAALAYGTKSIPRVSKIVGPGNRFVTAAKKMVAFDCAVEFLAGPTEAVIVSAQGDPAFIACDLVAQAEHDPDALCVFITTSNELAKAVQIQVQRRIGTNPIAAQSLSRNGAILLVDSLEQAVETANRIAPEHLTLPTVLVPLVQNAGSIFLNEFTPQSAGDYISGPNHVLPTGAMARVRGGLSILDYVRIISCQQISSEGIRGIAPPAIVLAEAEGLRGHAESLRVRCTNA